MEFFGGFFSEATQSSVERALRKKDFIRLIPGVNL
jgi:CDP-diglyceride synthetase